MGGEAFGRSDISILAPDAPDGIGLFGCLSNASFQ